MKKTIFLLLMLVLLLPSQAFAATVSTSYIEKNYFENYSSRVKEVKAAQNNLSKVLGDEVAELTNKSKVSTAKYTAAVKNKASKATLATIKATRDQDKKALSKAKSELATEVKSFKAESNAGLKEIAAYKADSIKMIKTHLEGKDNLSDKQFKTAVLGRLTYIDTRFNEILHLLRNA
ncbi:MULTISPECIES: hypothetical protein [Paenibacillus]|uniref:Uncharacterized protein n=1 Tax=Paenibacillus odorifer TaxID=189426 RepID=A0ABX3HIL1_9BACL|nr:hypothetical protein [Paenibacillus odorifer]OMD18634.1 hypothetical protein BJP48_12790 [Paenibacillus odorifer]OMD50457.1 hypothetical protein BSK51_15895 [Paenibacillus odorifer]